MGSQHHGDREELGSARALQADGGGDARARWLLVTVEEAEDGAGPATTENGKGGGGHPDLDEGLLPWLRKERLGVLDGDVGPDGSLARAPGPPELAELGTSSRRRGADAKAKTEARGDMAMAMGRRGGSATRRVGSVDGCGRRRA